MYSLAYELVMCSTPFRTYAIRHVHEYAIVSVDIGAVGLVCDCVWCAYALHNTDHDSRCFVVATTKYLRDH